MKTIIVGCGQMGTELAERLVKEGHSVTVVDKDPVAFRRLGPAFRGTMVEGTGFDRDVLIRAGVERTDALAALTSSDNVNIVTAQVARCIFRVPEVVACLHDPRRAEVYQRLGIPAISATAYGVSRIAQMLAHRDLDIVSTLDDGQIELVRIEAPPHLVGRTVMDLNAPGEISVAAIKRAGKACIPVPATQFQKGDQLTIAVLSGYLNRLENLLALR